MESFTKAITFSLVSAWRRSSATQLSTQLSPLYNSFSDQGESLLVTTEPEAMKPGATASATVSDVSHTPNSPHTCSHMTSKPPPIFPANVGVPMSPEEVESLSTIAFNARLKSAKVSESVAAATRKYRAHFRRKDQNRQSQHRLRQRRLQSK